MKKLAKLAAIGAAMLLSSPTATFAADPVSLPYTNDFSAAYTLECKGLDGFTLINSTSDGSGSWQAYKGEAYISGLRSNVKMDNWMITPPFQFEAGKVYTVTFKAHNDGAPRNYTEHIEVMWGSEPTVAGMSNTLLAKTALEGDKVVYELSGEIRPSASGIYYLGIHGCSDAKNSGTPYIDDLKVEQGATAAAPGNVTDMLLTPNPDGELKPTISFKAPTLDLDGNPLSSITRIEVYRDKTLAHTFTSPGVGEALSFVDNMTEGGDVTYYFQGFNEGGPGNVVAYQTFVGIGAPAAPANVKFTESKTKPGEITLSWDKVDKDENGFPMNPQLVTYAISVPTAYGYEPIAEGLTDTSFTKQVTEAGQQAFAQFAVVAVTEGGDNGVLTRQMPVGTAYKGMEESFSSGQITYNWSADSEGLGQWDIYTESRIGIPSQDDDNGLAAMRGLTDQTGRFISGKISLEGFDTPGVSFYTYNHHNDADQNVDTNELEVFVRESDAEEWTSLQNIVVNTLSTEAGWHRCLMSLSDFAGKNIQIAFKATSKVFVYTMLDNVKVGNLTPTDVKMVSLVADERVLPGETFTVAATVMNNGTEASGACTVDLYADGSKIDSETIPGLASNEKATVTFTLTMSETTAKAVAYSATVTCPGDGDPTNDTAEAVEVAPRFHHAPAVNDLRYEDITTDVNLMWSEPNTAGYGEPSTEDFEAGTIGSTTHPGWEFIDVDGMEIGGIENIGIAGIDFGYSKIGFFVFDCENEQYNTSFDAYSGTKYISTLYRYDDGQIDDWAISPELDGKPQTISFWAKSYSPKYLETIEMYYSTSGKAIADFKKVRTRTNLPNSWTEVTFDVPAGAKYFAIRSCATGSFMLMVDDVTFAPAGTQANLVVKGYDVYRDGEKLNQSLLTARQYTDPGMNPLEHEYVVVTHYTTGKSAPSNVAASAAGVADVQTAEITVSAGLGTITVGGAAGMEVAVAGIDGRVLFAGIAGDTLTVEAAEGVYVVKAAGKITKVIVK